MSKPKMIWVHRGAVASVMIGLVVGSRGGNRKVVRRAGTVSKVLMFASAGGGMQFESIGCGGSVSQEIFVLVGKERRIDQL